LAGSKKNDHDGFMRKSCYMKHSKVLIVLCACGFFFGCATAPVPPQQASAPVKYSVKVHEFEGCECYPSCPCIFSSDSPMGGCRGIIVFTITEGIYGTTRLKDVSCAAAFTWTGKNMDAAMGKWKGVLYTSDKATPAELEAIKGLLPALLGNAFGILEQRTAPLQVTRQGDIHELTVGKVARLRIHGLKDPNGKPARILNAPSPNAYPEYFCAQADVHTYDDGVSSWSFPGRNGYYADVVLSSGK